MGIFGKKKYREGLMDVIRCDEPSYLVWKWHPDGNDDNSVRENAIRWGSSLRVKEGEVAVFVYNQGNGIHQDYIEGPFDDILHSNNLPFLADVIGMAYNGKSPFQAEVYFINLAKIVQIPFAVPYFDLYDPRYLDFGVPTAVRGRITFSIKNYRQFIKLHRLIDFNLDCFSEQIKDAVSSLIKPIVANVPMQKNIPLVQIERAMDTINHQIENQLITQLSKDFGVEISRIDVSAIDVDKTSDGYMRLKEVTLDLSRDIAAAEKEAKVKNVADMQRIQVENLEESMRIEREESQYAKHKDTQTNYFAAYQLEQQASVGIAGAEALGNMGVNGASEVSGSGAMNPTGMIAGMAMGSAIGQNMAGMMNNMMSGINNSSVGERPPVFQKEGYHIVVNNEDAGLFDMSAISAMILDGRITRDTLVWKNGMKNWEKASEVDLLKPMFASNSNDVPPIPHND